MKCEICGYDPEMIVILNIPSKKSKGSLNTFACLTCAEESEAYCLRHNMPHLGFIDGTTACRYCIEEEVEYLGEKIANGYFGKLLTSLPKIEFREIYEWFEAVSVFLNEPLSKSILRGIVTYAKRHKKTPEEVVAEMIQNWKCLILE